MNQLQERIEELGSAIINHKEDKVYITGFYNSDRLEDWLKGIDCWQSKGIYNNQDVNYSMIRDNALFIIKGDKEIQRYQYNLIFEATVKYKTPEKRNASRKFTLRKCLYTNKYNIIFIEEKKKQSILFDSLHEVEETFNHQFGKYKLYDKDNKLIKNGFNYIREQDNLAWITAGSEEGLLFFKE